MASAPVKSTGGAGFAFEDKVGGYYASAMLAGTDVLQRGPINRVQFQRGVDGWLLDDVVLRLGAKGRGRHCAISVKSGAQFIGGRAPDEFVEAAWRQFLGSDCAQYDRERDLLGLACPPLDGQTRRDLNELQRLVEHQSPDELVRRLGVPRYVSESKRRLFASFACPDDLAKQHKVTDADTARLLRMVRVIPFDWESKPSASLTTVLDWTTRSVVGHDADDGWRLWEAILAFVNEVRTAGGEIEWSRLVDRLVAQIELVYRLDVSADWETLQELSRSNAELGSNRLGDGFHLQRAAALAELDAATAEERLVAVVGPSGAGKTGLTKTWANDQDAPVVWLRPSDLSASASSQLTVRTPLKHSLLDVLRGSAAAAGYVVVDALDAALDAAALEELAALFGAIAKDPSLGRWRVIATCQTQEWPRVVERLSRLRGDAANWRTVSVGLLESDDLRLVAAAFPAVAALQLGVRRPLQNLKILDLVVRHLLGAGTSTTARVTETSLSSDFWEHYVLSHSEGRRRGELLKALAERQADELESETALRKVPHPELVDELVRDGICVVRDERMAFAHDLLGDWIRHHVLLAEANDLPAYLATRLDSPLWHRAVRLYATGLIDEGDVGRWRAVFAVLDGQGTGLLQDLFLEAVVFSSRPAELLELVWPELENDDGALLRRLLRRFQHVATYPDPTLSAIFRSKPELARYGETMSRIPIGVIWLPLLRTLARHQESALELAWHQIAQIADTWLRRTPGDWPERDTAARLGLAVGERMFSLKQERRAMVIIQGDVDQTAYRAALAAASELPAEVGELVLRLCARSEDTAPIEQVESEFGTTIAAPPPWPDGPKRRVDEAFQKLCLTTGDALMPLVTADPRLVGELLLALLISPPRARERYGFAFDDVLGIEEVPGWRTPIPIHGPFFFFLSAAPDEAMETIFKLVNFATERRVAALTEDEGGAVPEVEVELPDGASAWLGDPQVYPWYAGQGVPRALAVPLMALEQWLYIEQNNDRDVTVHLQRILEGSRSVAFGGLLATIGCRRPALFEDTLRPLLAVPEFVRWDRQYKLMPHDLVLFGLALEPEYVQRAALEWHQMDHRSRDLLTCAVLLLLTRSEMEPFFEQVRLSWEQRLAGLEPLDDRALELRNLTAQLDLANYSEQTDADGASYWRYDPPEDLRLLSEEAVQQPRAALALMNFPMYCRRLLDGEESLDDAALDRFWDQMQELLEQTDQEDEELVNRDDVSCGAAALLIVKHPEWLERFPDRKAWCTETLLKAVEKPAPPVDELDSPRTYVVWRSEHFCAEAIPHIWADAPTEKRLRTAVTALAWPGHYNAISALFRAASARRAELRADFVRLQYYGLLMAELRMEDIRIRQAEQSHVYISLGKSRLRRFTARAQWRLRSHRSGPAADRRRAQKRRERARKAFIDGSLQATLPSWSQLVELPRTQTTPAPSRRRRQGRALLDMSYVQAAFSWLPSLDQTTDEDERAEVVVFWREALRALVRRLGEDIGPDDEVDGTPYGTDRWVIGGAAGTVVLMGPEEDNHDLWEPLLALGAAAHYWVEDFLRSWFEVALSPDDVPDSFVGRWRELIDYARSSPGWQAEHGRGGYYAVEHHWQLMGLDYLTQHYWLPRHAELLREMRPEYAEWAAAYLQYPEAAEHFIEFLKKEAAQPLVDDGLVWLSDAGAASMKGRHRRRDELPQRLAELLDHAWRLDATLLRREPVAPAFRELLRGLVDQQVPLALALSDGIAAGNG